MYGGSGTSDGGFRKTIQSGVRKVNYYTYMRAEEVVDRLKKHEASEQEKNVRVLYHEIAQWSTEAMKENYKKVMKVFSMK